MQNQPLRLSPQTVRPDWIDYNGHMNVAFYTVAFDRALDEWLDGVGIGPAYVAAARIGPYALQAHVHYLGEMHEGEVFHAELRLIDCDAKRLHVFVSLMKADGGLAATLEQVILYVDLTTRRATAYDPAALVRLKALQAAQAGLPRPAQLGQPIGLVRRTPGPATG